MNTWQERLDVAVRIDHDRDCPYDKVERCPDYRRAIKWAMYGYTWGLLDATEHSVVE